jgi:hypothetical protein
MVEVVRALLLFNLCIYPPKGEILQKVLCAFLVMSSIVGYGYEGQSQRPGLSNVARTTKIAS